MSTITESNGAQILPPVGDERATVGAYFAHLAVDADLRAKSRAYTKLAETLRVNP